MSTCRRPRRATCKKYKNQKAPLFLCHEPLKGFKTAHHEYYLFFPFSFSYQSLRQEFSVSLQPLSICLVTQHSFEVYHLLCQATGGRSGRTALISPSPAPSLETACEGMLCSPCLLDNRIWKEGAVLVWCHGRKQVLTDTTQNKRQILPLMLFCANHGKAHSTPVSTETVKIKYVKSW